MHDPSLGDPVIEQPEPVTLFLPVLEASLRRAGVAAGRDEMLRRFMSGEPRVLVVAGARDHPAQVDDDDAARRAVAAIWSAGALPFVAAYLGIRTIRLLLDATTTCQEGVTPAGLEIQETWG